MGSGRVADASLAERFASAIETEGGARVDQLPRIPIPPGAVALDGIEVEVLLTVTAPDPGPGGAPELVVERWSAVDRPRLHALAWRLLRVREVWRVHPDEGWIEVLHPTEGRAPQRVSPGGRVVTEGTGWHADFDVHAVVAGG